MTINSWGSDDPAEVAKGGTGNGTLTANNLLVGDGTNPVNFVSTGTVGQVLTSLGAGSDPTFQNATTGAPISLFIVDLAGGTPYATVQAALTAADAAGGNATVYVRPGTYVESLTLFTTVDLVGASGDSQENLVTISGLHTPPSSGNFSVANITLATIGDIFFSAAAGSTDIFLQNVTVSSPNGYIFDLVNWTGDIFLREVRAAPVVNDYGLINNTGGTTVVTAFDSDLSKGTTNATTIGSGGNLIRCLSEAAIIIAGGSSSLYYTEIQSGITFTGSSIGRLRHCILQNGSGAAVTQSSSGPLSIAECGILSATNPVIGGAGAGIVTIGHNSFSANSNYSGSLTISDVRMRCGIARITDLRGNFTDHGFMLGSGTDATVTTTAAPTDGQLPIGNTGNDPTLATLTSGTGISITNGSGTITVTNTSPGGLLPWTEVLGTSQAMTVNNGFIANNAALVTLTLPATAIVGDIIEITGKGAGGWLIAQNASQTIFFGTSTTTTGVGGSISSTEDRDSIKLVCVTIDIDFNVLNVGNLTVV